jgi:dipeptidyl aminopeptidase/acylaminoacyl peptidase
VAQERIRTTVTAGLATADVGPGEPAQILISGVVPSQPAHANGAPCLWPCPRYVGLVADTARQAKNIIERACRIPSGDGELDAVVTEPSAGTKSWVVMVHGAPQGEKAGPASLYRMLAARLASNAGIGSLRYDARGSGDSTGTFRDTTLASLAGDLRAARAWLDQEHRPERVALVGESLGGTIAVAGLDGTERALVLLYASIRLRESVPDWVSPDVITEAEQRGFIIRENSEVGLTFLREIQRQPDVAWALEGLRTPVLLIHGDHDREVDCDQSKQAAQLVAGPVKLVVVSAGDHGLERPGDQELVCQETLAWLAQHL